MSPERDELGGAQLAAGNRLHGPRRSGSLEGYGSSEGGVNPAPRSPTSGIRDTNGLPNCTPTMHTAVADVRLFPRCIQHQNAHRRSEDSEGLVQQRQAVGCRTRSRHGREQRSGTPGRKRTGAGAEPLDVGVDHRDVQRSLKAHVRPQIYRRMPQQKIWPPCHHSSSEHRQSDRPSKWAANRTTKRRYNSTRNRQAGHRLDADGFGVVAAAHLRNRKGS